MMQKNSFNFISFDPGITTGWASFDCEKPMAYGTFTFDEAFDELDQALRLVKLDAVVFENYRIRPARPGTGWQNTWSMGETMQVIGIIKFICHHAKIPVFSQEPTIKPQGYKMAGLDYVKGKSGVHVQDALAHGVFFWRTKGSFLHDSKESAVERNSQEFSGEGFSGTVRVNCIARKDRVGE